MTAQEVLWARDRAAEGYSAAQIARSLKRNPETVRRALRGDTHQGVEMPLGMQPGPSVADLQPPAGRPLVDPAPMTQEVQESLRKLQGMLGEAKTGQQVVQKLPQAVLDKVQSFMGTRVQVPEGLEVEHPASECFLDELEEAGKGEGNGGGD